MHQKSRFDRRRVFFAPNQKIQKTKYVFIGPINTAQLVSRPNFEIGTLSPPSTLIMHLNLAEEKIRKCLVHFFRIHGVSVTSFWEEFLLEPLQTIELFFSVFSYMIVTCLLLPASTISWTGWWAKTKLKTSKTEVLNQWSVLAKFQKNAAGRGERGGEKNKCR